MENLGQNEVPPQDEKQQTGLNVAKYGRVLLRWIQVSWEVAQRIVSQFFILINYLRRAETFKVKEDIRAAFGHLRVRRVAMMGAGVLLLMYIVSGFYMVNLGGRGSGAPLRSGGKGRYH